MALSDDLALLEDAARAAGDVAMGYFRRDPKVWWKEGNSPVSEADYAVDAYLRDRLIGERRTYGWVSEEMRKDTDSASAGANAASGAKAPRRFFVVDPIDGTRAYLRGETTWCVSIAIVENGRPVVAALVAPAIGETYTAVADGLAHCNGRLCSIESPADPASFRLAVPEAMRRRLGRVAADRFRIERAVPTLAYRLALVARGGLDGTLIRSRANDWDIAAADLIVERAGGRLCYASGEGVLYSQAGRRHGLLLAAANGSIEPVRTLAKTLENPEATPPRSA